MAHLLWQRHSLRVDRAKIRITIKTVTGANPGTHRKRGRGNARACFPNDLRPKPARPLLVDAMRTQGALFDLLKSDGREPVKPLGCP